MAQWQNQDQTTTAATSLHAANAVYIAQTQNDAVTLTTLAQLRAHQRDHGIRAALLYAAANLPQQAEAALAGAGPHADTGPARLAIAHAYYLSGDNAAVMRLLLNTAATLPKVLAQQRASLLARVLIRQKRYDEAALPLAAAEQLGDLPAIDRYNLGIAWLGAGADARGAGELNAIGLYRGDDPRRQALADQANLTLGYWLLNHDRAGQARRVLWRLPTSSPLARKGLLALGWTEFLPTKSEQPLIRFDTPVCMPEPAELWQDADPLHKVPRNHCRVPKVVRKQGRLAAVPGYVDANDKYARAAATWQAAIAGGDARNPVVAEALICLPYAFAQAGDLAQAQAAYVRAVARLDSANQQLVPTPTPSAETTAQPIATYGQRQLLRIRAALTHTRAHLQQRVAQLLASPKNRHAREVVLALKNMRRNTRPGEALTLPTPLQRGQLMLALAALDDKDANNASNNKRLVLLQQRVKDIDTQITQSLTAVDLSMQTLRQQNQRRQSEHIRTYLRDARSAFADLAPH